VPSSDGTTGNGAAQDPGADLGVTRNLVGSPGPGTPVEATLGTRLSALAPRAPVSLPAAARTNSLRNPRPLPPPDDNGDGSCSGQPPQFCVYAVDDNPNNYKPFCDILQPGPHSYAQTAQASPIASCRRLHQCISAECSSPPVPFKFPTWYQVFPVVSAPAAQAGTRARLQINQDGWSILSALPACPESVSFSS
jgi:hypothetical protein